MAGEPVYLPADERRSLRDRLFELGVEFPCGGVAQCGGCRIRVLEGSIPVNPETREVLSDTEIASGWRLACHAEATGPLKLEVEQWTPAILGDLAAVPVEPRRGFGVVIDIGTTTIVAQQVNLESGEVTHVESALNAQAAYGADVMSRIAHDLNKPGHLRQVIRDQIDGMLARLCGGSPPVEILLAGNTVMHHLWAGLPVAPLAAAPFRSEHLGPVQEGPFLFLPCAGGFAGSDLLMGLLATDMMDARSSVALLDLGTNGEIAVGDASGIRVASTAAGPAFEGGRIQQGMRAGAGAIDRVWIEGDAFGVHVIDGIPPRGLCGSGLVDAVAAGLQGGRILPNGRLANGQPRIMLSAGVGISQRDIRELQLAKAAVGAGLHLLLRGVKPAALYLAGAFGNYIRATSAQRIGLLPSSVDNIVAAGNTSLRGLRMLLLAPSRRESRLAQIASVVTHVELAADPEFQDAYLDAMAFS